MSMRDVLVQISPDIYGAHCFIQEVGCTGNEVQRTVFHLFVYKEKFENILSQNSAKQKVCKQNFINFLLINLLNVK